MNKEITFEQKKALVTISRRCMEEYEKVRASGAANMFNYSEVNMVAGICGFDELVSLSYEQYEILLMNFQFLMLYYDVKQTIKQRVK